MNRDSILHEVIPNPELMTKSIAEQGYNLETAIADLIDNSITANSTKIAIISNELEHNQSQLVIADNGKGMSKDILLKAMQLPSQSIDNFRNNNDLGRFGLGLKTASFSQSRKFTVISKDYEQNKYSGFSWDVDILKETGKWLLQELSENEIETYLTSFKNSIKNQLTCFSNDTIPSTIVFWDKLFKEFNYDNLSDSITNNLIPHLELVFHYFLEQSLTITVNNEKLIPFNPFDKEMSKLQNYNLNYTHLDYSGSFNLNGFVLPLYALKDDNQTTNKWCPKNKSLSDLEGIYVYRENRIIYYGGWPKLVRRKQHLKLARIKLSLSNKEDSLFQINVAKSKFEIPNQFLIHFKEIVKELDNSAYNVYYKNEVISINKNNHNEKKEILLREISTKGIRLSISENNILYQKIINSISNKQDQNNFKAYLKYLTKSLNYYANLNNESNIDEHLLVDNKEIDPLLKEALLELGYSENDLTNFL